jgi:hypothetical protein
LFHIGDQVTSAAVDLQVRLHLRLHIARFSFQTTSGWGNVVGY